MSTPNKTLNTIKVITGWMGSGKLNDPFRPALLGDTTITSMHDLSGANPLHSSTFTVQAQCNDAALTALMANPKYAGKVTIIQASVTQGKPS